MKFKLTLTQSELTTAVNDYLNAKGVSTAGKNVTVTFATVRKPVAGTSAEVEIDDEVLVATTSAVTVAVDATNWPTKDAVVKQKAEVQAEVQTEVQAVEPTEQAVVEQPASTAGKTSLFSGE